MDIYYEKTRIRHKMVAFGGNLKLLVHGLLF